MRYVECPACHGEGALLGVLGYLRWFRCMNCGIDFHRKISRPKAKK